MKYFGDGSRFGVRIDYNVTSLEDETGQRLKSAEAKIDPIFFFMYCDNYLPFSFEKMWEVYLAENIYCLVTIYSNDDEYTKSNIRLDKSGRVAVYDKKRESDNLLGVDIGYMITDKKVLGMIPEGNVSFEETVYPQLVKSSQLHAYLTHHRYFSIGDHKRLPMTDEFLARRPTVFVDRDGVLNHKMPKAEYVCSWKDWRWHDGAKDGLRLIHEAGYRAIIISNQAGIARGNLTESDLEGIHKTMMQEIEEAGGHVDAIYYCPHDWDEGCFCRKPSPGMLFNAQRDFNLDLSRTIFIGDDDRDGIAAEAAGAGWIKVTKNNSFYEIAIDMTKTHIDRKGRQSLQIF